MRWSVDQRYDLCLLVFTIWLGYSAHTGASAWPSVAGIVLILGIRLADRKLPEPANLTAEQYTNLHQRIDAVEGKVGRIELVNHLRPKGKSDASA